MLTGKPAGRQIGIKMTKSRTETYQPPDRARTREIYEALRPAYTTSLQGIYRDIRDLLEQHDLTPTIKYRVKRFDDFYEKLLRNSRRKKGPPVITDMMGLRIICPFLEDVQRAEQLISRHFEVVETVRKAAVHSFREFGYDSVHLLIRVDDSDVNTNLPCTRNVCEIQLRTILQDAWAEVEHELVYKSRLAWPNETIRRKLAALNATLTLSDLTFQEIRDYQKGVMAMGRKRRSALDSFLNLPGLQWQTPEEEPLSLESAAIPVGHGSPLEKAMLEALDAHSRHQFDRAVELYTGILTLRMNRKIRSLVYNHRGMALFSLARSKEAHRDFSRAIEYDEENLRARCNRGLVTRLQKRLAQAVEDYDRALQIDPDCADAWLGRAQAYLDMSFPDRALADCERALEIQPDFPAAKELLNKIRRDFFRT
jgi:putative GTP pyrophosphokinase